MAEKSRNLHKRYKKTKIILTCTNDIKISWQITEQNFASFVTAQIFPKWAKWLKNQETSINNRKNSSIFLTCSMSLEYRDE